MVEYLWGRHTLWYKKSILKWLNEEVCFFLGSTKCRQGDGPSQPLRPSQMLTENPQPNKGSALKQRERQAQENRKCSHQENSFGGYC